MTDVHITINGRKVAVDGNASLSYRDVADVAGFKSPALPTMTLHYNHGPLQGRTVLPGESVVPVDGMDFSVADTSNA